MLAVGAADARINRGHAELLHALCEHRDDYCLDWTAVRAEIEAALSEALSGLR